MSTSQQTLLDHEIEHGRKLMREGAESVWNWSSPAGRKRADRRAAFLVQAGKIASGDLALEIGCGTGLFSRKVFDLTGARIKAVDLSPELLLIARNSLEQRTGIEFTEEDAMHLSSKDCTFDVVFGSSILHHMVFDAALREILRVLKKRGRMVFAEPNMLNPQILIQKNIPFIKKRLGDSPDETAIVRWKLKKQMEELGFSNIRITPYDFLHPATPAAMIPFVDKAGRLIEKIPGLREIAGSVIIYAEK